MNAKQVLITTLVAAASAAALAGEIEQPAATRAQVRAEFLKARASGQLPQGEVYPVQARDTRGTAVSRAEVKEQFRTAQAAGELLPAGEGAAIGGGDVHFDSTLARADVKAEVIAARKAGELLPAGEQSSPGYDGRSTAVAARNSENAFALLHRKARKSESAQ